ncbi:MAG: hypothetical protein QXF56_04245 [Candidatus Micrarchaeia archaeon]
MHLKMKEEGARVNGGVLFREAPGVYKAREGNPSIHEIHITPNEIRVVKKFSNEIKDKDNSLHYEGKVELIFNPKTLRVKEIQTPKTSYSAFLEEKKSIVITDKVSDDGGGWFINFAFDLDEQSRAMKKLLKQKPLKDDFERITQFKPRE